MWVPQLNRAHCNKIILMNPVRTDMEKRLEEEGVQMKKERLD